MLIRLIIQPAHVVLELAYYVFIELIPLLFLVIQRRLRSASSVMISPDDVLDIFYCFRDIAYWPFLPLLHVVNLVLHYYVWHLDAFPEIVWDCFDFILKAQLIVKNITEKSEMIKVDPAFFCEAWVERVEGFLHLNVLLLGGSWNIDECGVETEHFDHLICCFLVD